MCLFTSRVLLLMIERLVQTQVCISNQMARNFLKYCCSVQHFCCREKQRWDHGNLINKKKGLQNRNSLGCVNCSLLFVCFKNVFQSGNARNHGKMNMYEPLKNSAISKLFFTFRDIKYLVLLMLNSFMYVTFSLLIHSIDVFFSYSSLVLVVCYTNF